MTDGRLPDAFGIYICDLSRVSMLILFKGRLIKAVKKTRQLPQSIYLEVS